MVSPRPADAPAPAALDLRLLARQKAVRWAFLMVMGLAGFTMWV